jgi:hypothetical protein
MSAAAYVDNLGVRGGSGLLAFVRTGFWHYSRHDRECKPGMWRVQLHGGSEMGEFWTMCAETDCVVDDFGDLRRVQ